MLFSQRRSRMHVAEGFSAQAMAAYQGFDYMLLHEAMDRFTDKLCHTFLIEVALLEPLSCCSQRLHLLQVPFQSLCSSFGILRDSSYTLL